MDPQAYGELVLLVICVGVAALASATETAMTSVGRLRVRHLWTRAARRRRCWRGCSRTQTAFLSTVLVVNTLALILASFATTLLSVRYVPKGFGFLGELLVSLVLSSSC